MSTLEAVTLEGRGHSYLLAPQSHVTAGSEYLSRVADRLRMRPICLASGGAPAKQVAFDALGLKAWTPSSRGVILAQMLLNDLGYSGSDARALTDAMHAVRAFLRTVLGGPKIESADAAISYTGAWTTVSGAVYSGGSVRKSIVTASSLSYTAVGDTTTLVFYGTDDASIAGGTVEVKVGSSVVATVDLANQCKASAGYDVVPVTVRVAGLGTGSHPITATITSLPGKAVYFDCVISEAVRRPRVVLVKETPVTDYMAGSAAGLAIYNALIDTVAADAEFASYVRVAGPNTGFDSALMLDMSDGVGNHLNDRGNAHTADVIVPILSDWLGTGWVDGVHRL